ncbi:MAG TPA: response regulator [Bacteroidales bacterium]|nr:response regulator [Bacteroidales bacterium]
MGYKWTNKVVLFAEDDEASLIYLSEMLKLHGASVIQCKSGSEAFSACLKNTDIDLVLMDMRLPELDGYEATRLIKDLRPTLPVVAVTACAMLEDRRKCKNSGCDGYLSKPVMPKEFLPMVQYFLYPEKARNYPEYSNY